MAVSPERRRELLAAVGLAEPAPPTVLTSSAVAEPLRPTQSADVPTQPTPQSAGPTQSVMVALREAAAERSQDQGPSLPPGIRPEFAHKPMPKARPWSAPPLREGQPDLARAQLLWEIAQADRASARRQMRALDPVGLGHWGPIDDD
jgi:hypothetical protein